MCYAERSRRARAGFTLVELLVALLISAIFATIVFQLLQGQGTFAAVQSAREEAQQNARGALDILAGELRSLPPASLVEANDHSLTFRLPRAWGVVCGRGSTYVDALFPSVPAELLASGSATGVLVNTGDESIPVWEPAAGLAVTGTTSQPSACASMGSDAPDGATLLSYRLSTASAPPAADVGDVLYLYQLVKYDVDAGDGGHPWLRRSNGVDGGGNPVQQPLAGPLPHADSLRFSYYSGDDGTLEDPAPGDDASVLDDISRIRIRLTTRSRGETGDAGPQYRRDSLLVHLRNRP